MAITFYFSSFLFSSFLCRAVLCRSLLARAGAAGRVGGRVRGALVCNVLLWSFFHVRCHLLILFIDLLFLFPHSFAELLFFVALCWRGRVRGGCVCCCR